MSNNFVVYDMSLTQIIQAYNLPSAIGTPAANSLVIFNLPVTAGVNALDIDPNALGIPVTY
jgi:hypothetical protein